MKKLSKVILATLILIMCIGTFSISVDAKSLKVPKNVSSWIGQKKVKVTNYPKWIRGTWKSSDGNTLTFTKRYFTFSNQYGTSKRKTYTTYKDGSKKYFEFIFADKNTVEYYNTLLTGAQQGTLYSKISKNKLIGKHFGTSVTYKKVK
ncbi:hypothetical protein LQZ18_14055 [Lachnospiraceae bacterium ZAX-1]